MIGLTCGGLAPLLYHRGVRHTDTRNNDNKQTKAHIELGESFHKKVIKTETMHSQQLAGYLWRKIIA